VPRDPFPKVKEARDAARARALEILEGFVDTIKLAVAAGDYEAAMKSYQWLLEHMPEDEGTRVIDSSVDNKKQSEGPVGPQINIGFRISGVPIPEPAQIAAAPEVIEASVSEPEVPEGVSGVKGGNKQKASSSE
jgi:hypothetical protein